MADAGIAAGIVYTPDEALTDRHVTARGFPVAVDHPEHGRTFTYPGPPYRFGATRWEIHGRAPLLGEHQHVLEGTR